MNTELTIKNHYGQLFQSVDLDLTPEEMLDLFWIVMVKIHELDIERVRCEIEIMRREPNYTPKFSEEVSNA